MSDVIAADNASEALGLDDWSVLHVELSGDQTQLAVSGLSSRDGAGLGLSDGGPVRFISGPEGTPASFAWLPDDETLLVSENNTREQLADEGSGSRLSIMGTDGSVVREVPLDPRVVISGGLAVNGDGNVAFAGVFFGVSDLTTDLASINLETGSVTRLTNTPMLNEGSVSVLADGSIVYSAGPGHRDPDSPSRVWLRSNDGSTRPLTSEMFAASVASASDGGTIVFLARLVAVERVDLGLWLTDASGIEPVLVATGVAFPSISRDGQRVVAVRVRDNSLVFIEL